MRVDYDTKTVTLELGDVVEVELPSGDSVWVWASGHILPKAAAARIDTGHRHQRRKLPAAVREEDPGS